MLTNSDLKAIKELIDPLREDLTGVKKNVTGLQKDVSGIKKDMTNVKEDIAGVKKDIAAVNNHNVRIENTLMNMEITFKENLTKWKSDLFDKIDTSMGELVKTREENVLMEAREEGRTEEREALSIRIEDLEKIHPNKKHPHVSQ